MESVISEEEEVSTSIFLAQVTQALETNPSTLAFQKEEEFFTPGSQELLEARQWVAKYSIPRYISTASAPI
jgi:hypothetical protein